MFYLIFSSKSYGNNLRVSNEYVSILLFFGMFILTFFIVTKAGVPANKIFVGESSYGRSFKMSKARCTGPTCTFEGDRLNSKANPGDCTATAGYISNAEIARIPSLSDYVKSWHDGASNSDIVVYNGAFCLPAHRPFLSS